jgi:adenosylmethionine-8-amino-7-oxononanoate aminotransferase
MAPAATTPLSTAFGGSKISHGDPSTSAVLHRNIHNLPAQVVAAKGLYITLGNGQTILDATGGAAVSCLGHGNERVKQAIQKQMDVVSYCHSLFYRTEVAEELAKELVRGTGGEMTRVYIVSSGKPIDSCGLETW